MSKRDKRSCFELVLFFWIPVLILGLLLTFTCVRKCEGQGAVYMIAHPVDQGVGIRLDYYPLKIRESGMQRPGIYHSVSYGSGGLYKLYGLGHHYKFTTGVLIPLPDYNSFIHVLTFGASYHHLSHGEAVALQADPKILRPWSFEAGLSIIFRRLAVCVNTDILRWEPSVGIGIVF